MQMLETTLCQLCYDYKPIHNTERIYNDGKKITACNDCLDDGDIQLAKNFSLLTGITYDRLISV